MAKLISISHAEKARFDRERIAHEMKELERVRLEEEHLRQEKLKIEAEALEASKNQRNMVQRYTMYPSSLGVLRRVETLTSTSRPRKHRPARQSFPALARRSPTRTNTTKSTNPRMFKFQACTRAKSL